MESTSTNPDSQDKKQIIGRLSIEYLRCWEDRTWDTDFVTVLVEKEDEEEQIRKKTAVSIKAIQWHDDVPVHTAIYSFTLDEMEDYNGVCCHDLDCPGTLGGMCDTPKDDDDDE